MPRSWRPWQSARSGQTGSSACRPSASAPFACRLPAHPQAHSVRLDMCTQRRQRHSLLLLILSSWRPWQSARSRRIGSVACPPSVSACLLWLCTSSPWQRLCLQHTPVGCSRRLSNLPRRGAESCRGGCREYNGNTKQRFSVFSMGPMDYAKEAEALLKKLAGPSEAS